MATAGTGVGVVAGAALTGAIKGAAIGALTGAITGAASGIKTLSSTSKLGVGKSGCTSSNCFVAGTKILTEHGKKNIEEIKVGDKVWSWNENTNKQELKTVVQLFRNNKRDMVYITVNGEKITTTTEHPFYVKGKGWVRAKDLLDTDRLVCYNGDELKIESVQIEYAESSVQTYNFEVEGNHNYYVGDVSVLAHNVCRQGAFNQAKRDLNIPTSQKPTKVTKEIVRMPNGSKATIRTYEIGNKIIRDDALGHVFSNGTVIPRHFNAGVYDSVHGFVSNGIHYFY